MDSPPVPLPLVKSPPWHMNLQHRIKQSAPSPLRSGSENTPLDDAVKLATLVVQRLASLANALLSGAEGAEVLRRSRSNIGEELKHDPTGVVAVDGAVMIHRTVSSSWLRCSEPRGESAYMSKKTRGFLLGCPATGARGASVGASTAGGSSLADMSRCRRVIWQRASRF